MEYIINSKKYGQKIVLLDEEDYKAVECRLEAERKYFPNKGVM